MAFAPLPQPFPLRLWEKVSTTGVDYLTLACYVVFGFLIGLDVWRALRKRATWLPGKAFALSGVTVQIIAWWTTLDDPIGVNQVDYYLFNYQSVVTGRVAVCVFIGYLLPGMAAPGVITFVALAITICGQIAIEVLLFLVQEHHIVHHQFKTLQWLDYSRETMSMIKSSTIINVILFICIIVLALLLGCTILASRTIHGLMRQRISAIFLDEFQFSNERTVSISWNDFEDKVVCSWFVARVCQVDYVMSRSVLSSAVGLVVTICVVLSLLSNTVYNRFILKWLAEYFPLFIFIIIGWVAIVWRWLVVQLYFRPHKYSWRRCLCLEDFWTSHIVELIHMYDLKRDRQRFQDVESSRSKMPRANKLQRLPTKIFTKVRLHKLLYLVLFFEVCVVFFSKCCGLLSEFIVGNFLYWCSKHMRKEEQVTMPEKYAKILVSICLPGEDPCDLWEANKKSFNKVKLQMQKGCMKGMSSEEIKSIFRLYSLQWAEDGIELLNKLKKIALPSVLKHFPNAERHSVKMTVVSLITIIIRLQKTKSDRLRKVLKACCEVWDLLCFADECDIDLQANEISLFDDFNKDKDEVCMAAEREFYKLQMEYEKSSSGSDNCVIDVEGPRRILEDLLEKCEGVLKRENLVGDCKEEEVAGLSDSKDWMKVAPSYTLYKLCKLMLGKDIEDFVAWTEESLRNVIACSMSRLPDMFVKQCWKWAQEFEEDKLWEVVHLAGKCRGMMEAWGLEPNSTVNTTQQWTIQVMRSTQFLSELSSV
ncbi:hypothetical protein SUGI_0262470 [Cryptomeria japonica]|uniref:uncharacterized protein LOC131069528 n=1 Tax=Cryptomeria japonica TaxID=3369 RepID=UPI002408E537|nr:uncharacterized protein LOC131069528 [Cryptomeria japonica]XP_059074358.1 uncharacterized protein LOC131069528 [Cryptomeria japonica]XP_059074359.1 uncharacterized protein LOC131069528 [Cryptomeria japonica]XP_059074360.1 uncharacterized protein LOC131069528 [Cryptomeria japonica]GLJ15894.1 hypothetical protein SUGI_0262470 [Cryptomeria japonica]